MLCKAPLLIPTLICANGVLFWLHLKFRPMLALKIYQTLEKYKLTDAVLIALIVIMKVIYKIYKV
jgi:hypothetical protein